MASDSGPHLFIDRNMDVPVSVDVAEGHAVVWTSRSPDKETANEDAALVIPITSEHGILAVADGFGGHPSGDEASKLALKAIARSVRNRDPDEQELRSVILDGFEMANEAILALGVRAATTLAVVEIKKRWVRSYHCGDTGIIVVGNRGRIKARTVDHTPTGYAMEAGMMKEREALRHEERHIVFNMIGSPDMRIEVGPSIQLSTRDTILVASDGLFDNLTFDTIVEGARKGPLSPSLLGLATAARKRMQSLSEAHPSKPDDLTIVAYRSRNSTRNTPNSQ